MRWSQEAVMEQRAAWRDNHFAGDMMDGRPRIGVRDAITVYLYHRFIPLAMITMMMEVNKALS